MWAGIGLIAAGSLALRMGLGTLPSGSRDVSDSGQAAVSASSRGIESELHGAVPRSVQMTKRGMLVVATWTITLAVFASLAHQHFGLLPPPARKGQLDAEGSTSAASVHSRDEREIESGRSLYFIGYNFSTESGAPLRVNRSVPRRVFLQVAEGDTMPVVYFPGNPEVHYLPRITSPVSTRLVFFAGGLLLAAAGVGEAQRRMHRRLVSTGTPVAGFVTDVRRRGGVRSFRVNYDIDGQRQSLAARERNPDLRTGQTATVLCNPAIPKRAVIYRLAMYKARA